MANNDNTKNLIVSGSWLSLVTGQAVTGGCRSRAHSDREWPMTSPRAPSYTRPHPVARAGRRGRPRDLRPRFQHRDGRAWGSAGGSETCMALLAAQATGVGRHHSMLSKHSGDLHRWPCWAFLRSTSAPDLGMGSQDSNGRKIFVPCLGAKRLGREPPSPSQAARATSHSSVDVQNQLSTTSLD